ncbi:MAG: tetratricopeptide repeat protein [Acidobacteriota bacterium]|nr:tetratricopeptide repeat protein [Acidobacteriota bacterium]
MKNVLFALAVIVISGIFQIAAAQTSTTPTPPKAMPTISESIAQSISRINDKTPVSRERREGAYAKLLEGQGYIWKLRNARSDAALASGGLLARQSLQRAVELDPVLAEAYTALAELAKNAPPYNIEDSITLAVVATKIDANNFGGHLILAQLYTFKSRLNRGILDPLPTEKAIAEWKEVVRLDPRSAEAHAFLSDLYGRTGKPAEKIAELRSWVASAPPISNGFYGRIFRGESLAPENAALKLGEALTKAGQTREAVEILSLSVADDPNNQEAVDLLGEAVKSADEGASAVAVEALKQAVYANAENTSLLVLLAQVQAKAGKTDDAAKVLQTAATELTARDENSAANLQTVLGDIFAEKNRYDEAVTAYQNALTIRGIGETDAVAPDRRDFAIRIFDKIIEIYRKSNRLTEAKAVIERARLVLRKSDLFADKG